MADQMKIEQKELVLESETSHRGLTPVVIVLAVIWMIVSGWLVGRSAFRLGPDLDYYTVPVPGVLLYVLPLFFVGLVYRRLRGKVFLTQAEFITLYCMLAVAGLVLTGTGFWVLIGNIMSLNNLIRGADLGISNYEAFFQPILKSVSSLVVPRGDAVVQGFFMGNTSVPWGSWIGPMLLWTIYITVIVSVLLCLASIFRRYLTDIQHYTFPLTIPIVEMLSVPDDTKAFLPSFWRNRLMLLGASIPVLLGVWNELLRPYILPGLPVIPTYWTWDERWDIVPPFGFWTYFLAPWPGFRIGIFPMQIGIGYLVPSSTLFSLWFFHLLMMPVLRGVTGYFDIGYIGGWGGLGYAAFSDQFYVGAMTLCVITFIQAREHLAYVWRCAVGKITETAFDRAEAISYRMSVWGAVIGILFLLLFNYVFLGVALRWSIVLFSILLAVFTLFARVRAEMGLPYARPNTNKPDQWLMLSYGGKVFGKTSIAGAGLHVWLQFGCIGSVMALATESSRMADEVRMSRKTTVRAIAIVIPLAVLIAFVLGLTLIYNYGFNLIHPLWDYQARGSFREVAIWAFPSSSPNGTLPFYGEQSFKKYVQPAVVLFVVFLAYMRRFAWWPLTPFGYVFAMSDQVATLWASFFLAWLIKTLLIRYRGHHGLRQGRPFFLGLITGSILWSGISFMMSLIFPV